MIKRFAVILMALLEFDPMQGDVALPLKVASDFFSGFENLSRKCERKDAVAEI